MNKEATILDNTQYCFGKGAKGFITLWQCFKYGAVYIKTVAKTQEKADELYPGLEQRNYIGTRLYFGDTHKASATYDTGCFLYGKYNRCTFESCDDYSYLMWYMTTIPSDSQDWAEIYSILQTKCHHITDEEKEFIESAGYVVPDFVNIFIPSYFGVYGQLSWNEFIERCNRRIEIRRNRDALIERFDNGEDYTVDIKHVDEIICDGVLYFGVKLAYNMFLIIHDIETMSTYYGTQFYVRIGDKRKKFTKRNCTLTNISYMVTMPLNNNRGDDSAFMIVYESDMKSINHKIEEKTEEE